ncbi:MAG: hypothetical protein QOE35_1831 [Actinomycetota bacterium]
MTKERSGGDVPLGVHQVIEYLMAGFALVSIARIEPKSAPLCAGAAAMLALLAGLSGGRAGVVRIVGPRLHRVLDYVAAAALATSPWWSGVGWGGGGVWVVESLAVVVVWLARATSYRRRPPEPPQPPAPPEPRRAATPTVAATARTAGRLAGVVGRKGPRAAGVAVGRIKKRKR